MQFFIVKISCISSPRPHSILNTDSIFHVNVNHGLLKGDAL